MKQLTAVLKAFSFVFILTACSNDTQQKQPPNKKDSTIAKPLFLKDTAREVKSVAPAFNDTLNEMAAIIAGEWKDGNIYNTTGNAAVYRSYANTMNKRWHLFDSTRIKVLTEFRNRELDGYTKNSGILFYPFSGPDYLYPGIFFPDSKKIIMLGLEPVGTMPAFNAISPDSLAPYFGKLNTSLYAILNFSFFRTESMKRDLQSGELNGTLHLLLLFMHRTGCRFVAARPLTIDTNGVKQYYPSFEKLNTEKLKTKGIEISFVDASGIQKELNYLSLDASDYYLKNNVGFRKFIQQQGNFMTYLKGASYLLHKTHFSITRNLILNQSSMVVQDDSGIGIKYFLQDSDKWEFRFYGQYTKPIRKFAGQYQPLLDSMYKLNGATKLDFGLGYNFKDKNSNFMIARLRSGNTRS